MPEEEQKQMPKHLIKLGLRIKYDLFLLQDHEKPYQNLELQGK